MNAVSIAGLTTVILAAIIWFIDGMLFGGFCIGLMFTSATATIFHRRELRRIQADPSYLWGFVSFGSESSGGLKTRRIYFG